MTPILQCDACGGNRFTYPLELTDQAIIHCEDCRAPLGTVAEVRERIVGQIAADSSAASRSSDSSNSR